MKFGIIGLGKISPSHIGAIRDVGGEIVATCDIDKSKRTKEFKFFTHYGEMLGSERLDVVSICTPNFLHYEMARDVLLMDSHCIVEKPFVLSVKEVDKLRTISELSGFKLFPILQNRYNPVLRYVKKILDEGKLGKVYAINMTQHWYRPRDYFNDWHGSNDESGGTLITLGIHFLDMIFYLLDGKPENIVANMEKFRGLDVEDSVTCTFNIGYVMATVAFSILAYRKNFGSRLGIVAEKGTIEIGGSTAETVTVWDCDLPRPPTCTCGQNVYDGYTGSLALHPEVYRDVVKVIEGGEQEITYEDAVKAISFIEEVKKVW